MANTPPLIPAQDPTSVYFIDLLENQNSPLLTETQLFNGDNYSDWRRSMMISLSAKNKLSFVDGSLPKPDYSDPTYNAWVRCNDLIISYLLRSVDSTIAKSVLYFTTAHEIWKDLEERFSKSSGPQLSAPPLNNAMAFSAESENSSTDSSPGQVHKYTAPNQYSRVATAGGVKTKAEIDEKTTTLQVDPITRDGLDDEEEETDEEEDEADEEEEEQDDFKINEDDNFISDKFMNDANTATGNSVTCCAAEEFFDKVGASSVFSAFEEALQSGDIEAFGRVVESEIFRGIIVLLCVYYKYNADENQKVLLKFLERFVIGSKCDLIGFTSHFGLEETHQLALEDAMMCMMSIFENANQVDQPANMVAEAMVSMYESGYWQRVFYILFKLLKSTDKPNLLMIGLVIVTAIANLCTQRHNKKLSTVIHKSKIVAAMFNMNFRGLPTADLQRRAISCSEALGGMPGPSKSSIARAGRALVLGKQ